MFIIKYVYKYVWSVSVVDGSVVVWSWMICNLKLLQLTKGVKMMNSHCNSVDAVRIPTSFLSDSRHTLSRKYSSKYYKSPDCLGT